ncbi:MAG: methyltransferase [Glaciihabitans sp.]|nr:methyltransferase [Glaciihabitans sp.]MCW2654448.1 methyltransferase [Mycobacterium sp.]
MPPKGTRPTTDRVREALFNVLSARLELTGSAVLDLYAGSGALGLEALSRGAAVATFVEADARAAAVIRRNIDTLGLTGATVLTRPVVRVLETTAGAPVDLVVADPPYDLDAAEIQAMLAALASGGWTRPGTVVAVERRAGDPLLIWPEGFSPWRQRRYGDTRVEIAERT